MRIIISKIVDGFNTQWGAAFGFGTHADDSMGLLLKISTLNEEKMAKVNKTTVHSLTKERNVSNLNNEVKIRGKENLESVSRKMVLNKSFDLLEEQESTMYLEFSKPA